jgi:hypothetical protein
MRPRTKSSQRRAGTRCKRVKTEEVIELAKKKGGKKKAAKKGGKKKK